MVNSIDIHLQMCGFVQRTDESGDDFQRRIDDVLNTFVLFQFSNYLETTLEPDKNTFVDISGEVNALVKKYFGVISAPIMAYECSPAFMARSGDNVGGSCVQIKGVPVIYIPKRKYSDNKIDLSFSKILDETKRKVCVDLPENIKKIISSYPVTKDTFNEIVAEYGIFDYPSVGDIYPKYYSSLTSHREFILLHESIHALQTLNEKPSSPSSSENFRQSIARDKLLIDNESWAYVASTAAYLFENTSVDKTSFTSSQSLNSKQAIRAKQEILDFNSFAAKEIIIHEYLSKRGYDRSQKRSSLDEVVRSSIPRFSWDNFNRLAKPLYSRAIEKYADSSVDFVQSLIAHHGSAKDAVLSSLGKTRCELKNDYAHSL